MKTEIEVFEANIIDGKISVDYALYDADSESNIHQQFRKSDVLKFITDTGMNMQYVGEPDDLVAVCPICYLGENIFDVVKAYIEFNLEVA